MAEIFLIFMNENIVIDSSLRTVEWKDNKVIMIEQTKLPNELIFVEYDDFNQVANAIKTLIVTRCSCNWSIWSIWVRVSCFTK